MSVLFSNSASTTLSAGVGDSATSITVADGSVFPAITGSDYFYLTLEVDSDPELKEIVKCTARSGNTLTIARGQDSTSARTFSTADKAQLRLTAAGLNDVATQADTDTTYSVQDGELSQNNFTNADHTKLDGIEASADVTATANVTAAGGLMDSELTAIASVKALNQGVATTDDPTFTNTQLAAIAQSKSDTAVDVFVYDTSKDSDGGAWRNRTQGTSWYNEALNTATRGATKKFPSVAVIVAENYKVTIYDGDDPSMPMWMVFNGGTNTGYSFAGFSPSSRPHGSIVMLNGVMATGSSGAGYLTTCSFLDEKGVVYLTGSNGVHVLLANIVDRNETFISTTNLGNENVIANGNVNDVAMTVLPNAPIDADTGLPVPTIAVATNGGVSVIKDDGTVVDITASAGASYSGVGFISFDSNHNMIFEQDNSGRSLFYIPIPSADRTSSTSSAGATDKKMLPFSSTNTTFPKFNGSSATIGIGGSGEDQYIYGGTGVTHYAQGPSDATSSVAYTASDYNTGWMNGDIKLATLSDTDDTDANPSELVINGDFSNGTSGWTVQLGAVLSVSNGQLSVQSTGANSLAYRYFTADLNESHILTVTVISGVGVLQTQGYGTGTLSAGTYTLVMPAGRGNNKLDITPSVNTTFVVGNVSIKRAEPDRSVNGNGLQVFGTVTKTAVATGADLVAYSGFTGNNYFRQPYNADLQFGTGSFSVMGWYKVGTVSSTYRCLVYINSVGVGSLGNDNHGFQILIDDSERLYSYVYGPETDADLVTSGVATDGAWHMFCHVTQDQSNHALYIDGVKRASSTDTTGNINNTDAQLMVGAYGGVSAGNAFPFTDGSLANIRVSATAPTAEQIAKMYRDEKPLFQEGAQATLYGTSDAVTALAYDDDTELLHAGTSAGRSVFQGLRRVENTTDAVGSAISASNGLVAED